MSGVPTLNSFSVPASLVSSAKADSNSPAFVFPALKCWANICRRSATAPVSPGVARAGLALRLLPVSPGVAQAGLAPRLLRFHPELPGPGWLCDCSRFHPELLRPGWLRDWVRRLPRFAGPVELAGLHISSPWLPFGLVPSVARWSLSLGGLRVSAVSSP